MRVLISVHFVLLQNLLGVVGTSEFGVIGRAGSSQSACYMTSLFTIPMLGTRLCTLSLQCYWLPKKGEPSLGPLLGQRIPFSFRSGALCRVASIRITQRYFYYALLAMWTHPDGQWSYLSQAFSFRCRC